MDSTKRIIINTLAQYSRSLLNILLSLFSTRYIVEALGVSDYGLYVVVGGVVALLGFITNALVITTQRFISFYFGKSDKKEVHRIFANSLTIHLILSLLMIGILFCVKDLFVYHWLNIPSGREAIAADVYVITIFILVTTIMTAPFKALFIARENIVYISVVEVFDGILKLGIAIWILFTDTDRLLLYAILMLSIQIINILAYSLYALHKYEECHILISYRELDFSYMRQLAGFAGWSTYSMGAIVFRNQGIQLILNRFLGTLVNAAYGIAMQVYSSLAFVASSILNAMNPQIMKAEGEGNRKLMLQLAEKESKYSTMLLLVITVPLMFELPDILALWLREVPQGCVMFCQFILCGFIIDQTTYGINTAILATGRIKYYTLLMYTPKLLVIPPIYYLIRTGHTPLIAMYVYLIAETLVSIARLPYIKFTCGLDIRHFLKHVISPLIPLLLTQCAIGYCSTCFISLERRYLLTIPLSIAICGCVMWFFTLSMSEREYACKILTRKPGIASIVHDED
jgi:O-antigen/teichoic acid export membrane protein